jgi:hypothetical protein
LPQQIQPLARMLLGLVLESLQASFVSSSSGTSRSSGPTRRLGQISGARREHVEFKGSQRKPIADRQVRIVKDPTIQAGVSLPIADDHAAWASQDQALNGWCSWGRQAQSATGSGTDRTFGLGQSQDTAIVFAPHDAESKFVIVGVTGGGIRWRTSHGRAWSCLGGF